MKKSNKKTSRPRTGFPLFPRDGVIDGRHPVRSAVHGSAWQHAVLRSLLFILCVRNSALTPAYMALNTSLRPVVVTLRGDRGK
jgi:hypothetical protein